MKGNSRIAVLLLILLEACKSGHIFTWDVDIYFQNEKNANTITFFFSLESGLAKNQFLRVRFPETAVRVVAAQIFAVGSPLAADTASIADSASGDIFVQTKLELVPTSWYQMTLTFDPIWVPTQTSGYKGVIYMDTSSGTAANRIIYDSNPVAAVYQLAPKPAESMGVSIRFPSSVTTAQRSGLGSSYDIYIDLRPQIEVLGGSLLRIDMSPPESFFRFGGSCQGADQTCADGQPNCENITLVQGNCALSSDNRRIVLAATSDIFRDKTIRIKATVNSPPAKRDSGGIVVYSISKIANFIFEKVTKTGVFSVDGIVPGKATVKYLWGVSTFNSKTLCPLGFYKKATTKETVDGQAAKVDVFNDLYLEFSIPSTPTGQNLRVEISTPPSGDFDLIKGSMRNDLPTFSGKPLIIDYLASSSGGLITITNVNPVYSSSTYRFQAKIKFEASQNLGSQKSFAITVKTVTGEGSYVALCSGPEADFKVVRNYEFLDIGGSDDGIHNYGNQEACIFDNPLGYNSIFSKNDPSTITNHGVFLRRLVDLDSPATGYNGVGLGPDPVQELIIVLAATTSQLCCADSGRCELGEGNDIEYCVTSNLCEGQWVPAISLNIVANTNILKLDSATSPDAVSGVYKGITTYGTFWGGCGYSTDTTTAGLPFAATTCVSSGKKLSTTSSMIKNGWDTSDTGIAYLQATCVPTAHQNPAGDECLSIPVNAAADEAATWTVANTGALGIRKKDLDSSIFSGDKVSQLYPSQYNLDFLLCFGFSVIAETSSPHTRPASLSSYVLASQSLLNVFIINIGSNTANLRVRFFNYLAGESSNLYKSPQFLRVSGYLASGSYNAIHIFLDQSIGISNAKFCASSSAVSCVSYSSLRQQLGSPALTNRIDLIGSIDSGLSNQLEYFIPITPANFNPTTSYFIDLGLSFSDDAYWSVREIYRFTGYLWGDHQTSRLYKIKTMMPSNFNFDSNVADNGNIGGSGCFSSGNLIPLSTNLTFPGSTVAGPTNWAAATSAKCLGAPSSSDVQKGGTGFIVSHFSAIKLDLLGSATAKWANSINCIKFSFGSASNGFVCGLGLAGDLTNAEIPASNDITVKDWTIPWTWGANYPMTNMATSFAWSAGDKGQRAAYWRQSGPDNTAFQKSCTLSDWGTVYRNADFQKLTFTFIPSSGISLSASQFELLVSFKNTPEGLSFGACTVTYSSGTGTCAASRNGASGTFAFARNAPFTASLAKGTQSVTLVISQTGSAWSSGVATTTLNAAINYESYQIDACGTDKLFSYNLKDITPILKLSAVAVQPAKSSRSSFSFTFSISSDQRQIVTGSSLEFNLGWLGDNLAGIANNMHCFIKSGSKVSFGWSSLDLSKPESPILSAQTENAPGSYIYNCEGARAPSLTSSTRASFAWKVGSKVIASISDSDASALSPINFSNSAKALELVLLSKFWNSPGFEASYLFSLKPKKANYSAEARIYVDFSIDIPPRGNRADQPSCEIDLKDVYCEWTFERRLVVWPVSSMLLDQSAYLLAVHGVAQPTAFSSFKDIGVTIDDDANPFNGVGEWNEIADKSPSSAPIIPLQITAFENSNPITRASTDLKISLMIPKNKIVKDGKFYAELPHYLADALVSVNSVPCSLVRISDANSTNLAQNCTKIKNRRFKIFTNEDSANSLDTIYTLTLSSVPSPYQPSLNAPCWANIYFVTPDDSTVTASTFPGNINASWPLFFHQTDKQVPDWFAKTEIGVQTINRNFEVAKGTYGGEVILRSQTVSEVTYGLTLGGDIISSVMTYPSNLRVDFGVQDLKFRIAAKTDAVQGRYLLSAFRSQGDAAGRQTPIPPLAVLIKNSTCQVNANLDTVKLPAGGWSLPIVFDYIDCMPLSDIQLDANFSAAEKYNISFGPDEATTTASEKLVFQALNKTRISFIVKSFNASQVNGSKTVISFSNSGSNKDSYKAPKPLAVELIDPTPFAVAPTLKSFSSNATAGQVELSFSCSSPGNIFYALARNPDVQNVLLEKIKKNTYSNKLSQTLRDPSDPWWNVQGYVSQTSTSKVSATVVGLASASMYYSVAFCQNQLDLPSSNSLKISWNQTDNGGRVAKATITFNDSLAQYQLTDIACAFARQLKVPRYTVLTQEGSYCSSLRIIQGANNTSSPNVSLGTNTSKYNVSYVWFVLPDYAASTSQVHLDLKKLMGPGFLDKLFSQTSNKTSTFPAVLSYSSFWTPSAFIPAPFTSEINPRLRIFENYISFAITLSNSAGFLYWGVGSNSSIKPYGRVLRDGYDNIGSPLLAFDRKYLPPQISVQFNVSGIQFKKDTEYKLFLSLTNDDPTSEASFSDVVEKLFFITSSAIRLYASFILFVFFGFSFFFGFF